MVRIAGIPLGEGAPLVLIAGLNVIESEESTLKCAARIKELALRYEFPLIFKASFDKANRSSVQSYRGPGLEAGLRILSRVKKELGLVVTTDVHEPAQAKPVADVVDCLQVPAFLCRQTDLLAACAATGRPVNIKKGQFMAPLDMVHAVEKMRAFGGGGVFVTERGTTFGYNNIVVDMKALGHMRTFAPVCYDATHAVQRPGGPQGYTLGDREFVLPMARAAVCMGIDALFIEAHPDPANAPCDGPSQITFEELERLLHQIRQLVNLLATF